MDRHASINRMYRLVWSHVRHVWVPVAETAKGRGKSGGSKSIPGRNVLAAAISLALARLAHGSAAAPPCVAPMCGATSVAAATHPLGGQVVSGSASITQAGGVTDIRQSSADVSIDWLSFSIGARATVDFMQPSSSAIAVNHILGNTGSQIFGHLEANGQVWLINPNGVLFGQGAEVNVGGLVASTLEVSDSSVGGDARSFAGNGAGSIVNQGAITANEGGYVALLANHVSNQGVITAQLGTVALGAGSGVTLDFSGNRLVHLQVDQSTLNSLASNNQLIVADGGLVIMTAGARDTLLASVVNNTGVIEARTVQNREGAITLLAGMSAGTANVAGTLDASAPNGGDGGSIETSAAHVEVANDAKITTAASKGLTGSWLVDPQDFTIAPGGGDITGSALSADLATNSITLESFTGAKSGSGNINVDDTVSWSANTLTLTAANNINVNAVMTATGSAALALNPSTANGTDSAVPGGSVVLGLTGSGFTGMVNFNSTGTLSINGITYTVINSLGAQGSTTGTDLQGMQGNLSGVYALGSNINAAATSAWNGGAGFAPVGSSTSAPFTGTFDGLGHTISNLYINRGTTSDVGLFGATDYALIRYVAVAGTVIGSDDVGGLVGYNSGGSISNSYATASVNGNEDTGGLVGYNNGTGSVNSSYATGAVSGGTSGQYIGGLIGFNYSGSVTNSYSTGNVTGGSSSLYIGGLMGVNLGNVSNSYATGSVSGSRYVGGLVGSNVGTVSNSYATGGVTGTSKVGGLAGFNASYGSISNSYATGIVSGYGAGNGDVGGLVGYNYAATVTTSYATGRVSGNGFVGGLIGYNYNGYVNNSYATGNVSGNGELGGLVGANRIGIGPGNQNPGLINNSHATGSVTGTDQVGGLVGLSYGAIVNSYATGAVSGSYNVGGLVGYNAQWLGPTDANYGGIISNSYATGSVSGGSGGQSIGGLVGGNLGIISTSYATGRVSGSSYVGGLVGFNYAGGPFPSAATVSESYATGSVSGGGNLGGLVGGNDGGTVSGSYWNVTTSGQSTSAGGTGLTAAQMQTATNFTGFGFTKTPGAQGWVIVDTDGSLNNTNGAAGATYPMLASEYSTTISNAHQLQLMAMAPATYYVLVQNIDAAGTGGGDVWGATGLVPIGSSSTPFIGTFDGHGYTISNLSINRPSASDVGLFGAVGSLGVVRNVGLIGGSVSGEDDVGGLVGYNNGTVSGSYMTGSASGTQGIGGLVGYNNTGTINSSYATGTVSGSSAVGALVGENGGTVSNSYAMAGVSGVQQVGGLVGYDFGPISASYATGNVSGGSDGQYVGGLVGENAGTVSDSYATGSVSGSDHIGGLVGFNIGAGTITSSYATGSTSGTKHVGGLVGYNGGDISSSYATGTVSGGQYIGGLVGYDVGTVSNSFWDTTTSGQSTSAGGIGMATANMQSEVNFIAATVADGNVNPNWDFASTWVMYSGYTYPLLRVFMTPLTVSANSAVITYNGSPYSATGVAYSTTPIPNLLFGTLNYGGGAQGPVNVGVYTLGGLYSDQQGYIITYGDSALRINPLASVAWVGGATGNWSKASNWADGAIPDLSNVEAVTIPKGTTVTYDDGVAGTTILTTLTDKGNLVMAAGTLATTGNLSTVGYTQSGGTLEVGGTLTVDSRTGAVTLGNVDAGALSITSAKGAITQLAGTVIDVTGTTALASGADAITLGQAGNTFGGTVTADGGAITLTDAAALTAIIDGSGATSLTSAGDLNVSGTIGTLTTATTGTDSATTFGATTVRKSLTVVSTGAVTETSSNILTVDGIGTTTVSNAHVTVNGVKGAKIPAP